MADKPSDIVRKRLDAYRSRLFAKAMTAALHEAADKVRAEAHRMISAGSVSGKKHEPSAPNTPPNRDTGTLQAGLEVSTPEPMVARVTANAAHSSALEFGTSKMQPRPFLRPARDKVRPMAEIILKLKINKIRKEF